LIQSDKLLFRYLVPMIMFCGYRYNIISKMVHRNISDIRDISLITPQKKSKEPV